MTGDPWDDPAAKAWARHVIDDMVPKLKNSAVSISIVPDAGGDVKFWVELGAAIMLEKPIIAVSFGGRYIPPRLRQIADEIVYLDEGATSDGAEAVAEAIERVIGRGRG